MQWSIVANHRGRRVIRWKIFLKTALIIMPIPSLLPVLVRYKTSRQWSQSALFLGLGAGALITLFVFVMALCTPLQKLPMLSENPRNR